MTLEDLLTRMEPYDMDSKDEFITILSHRPELKSQLIATLSNPKNIDWIKLATKSVAFILNDYRFKNLPLAGKREDYVVLKFVGSPPTPTVVLTVY